LNIKKVTKKLSKGLIKMSKNISIKFIMKFEVAEVFNLSRISPKPLIFSS